MLHPQPKKHQNTSHPLIISLLLLPLTLINLLLLESTPTLKSTAETTANPPLNLTQTPVIGAEIVFNTRKIKGQWLQTHTQGNLRTYLNDGVLQQLIGIELLSTDNFSVQPIDWFSKTTEPKLLKTKIHGPYRYLDITDLAHQADWQIQATGNSLTIVTPPVQLHNIRQNQQNIKNSRSLEIIAPTARIVLDLNREVPWQISQGQSITAANGLDEPNLSNKTRPPVEWLVSLEAATTQDLIQKYRHNSQIPSTNKINSVIRSIESLNNRTLIRLRVPFGMSPRVFTLANPHRLVIDLRPDALVPKNIAFAPGLHWRQKFINLGTEQFPVISLEINPQLVKLKPINLDKNSLIGTAPLIQIAQESLAIGAINGGYFNRHNKLPLGAIRRDKQWLSSPILNRGAIAWNDHGEIRLTRLSFQETLITNNQHEIPLTELNSGYIQTGIGRYTRHWGNTYTPLLDNETIIVVEKDKITNQIPGGKAGANTFPIPDEGYLLTLRAAAIASKSKLPLGTTLTIKTTTNPPGFDSYAHIIAAGPLLIQNNQIVLDAEKEKFSQAFIKQKAIRSGICITAANTILLTAIHNSTTALGATLAQHTQIMKHLGCIDALNLDGGSSTSLYLSGQLLNRSANNVARVHNGIGIFIPPPLEIPKE